MDPATLAMIMQAMQSGKAGLGGMFGGLFGNSGDPYRAAGKEYQDYYNQGKSFQNPFFEAGKGAIPQFQEWLNGMKNPSDFINNLMGQYQESPYAKFQQQQAVRAGQNMGSASGLTGSTPLAQFAEQNARDISSQDMNQWLQNVLGINTQYGAGLSGEMGMGQGAGNVLSNMAMQTGGRLGESEYGRKAGEQSDRNSIWGGLFS